MTAGIRTMGDLSAMCVNGFHDACDERCLDYCHDLAAQTPADAWSSECRAEYHEACPDGACICMCHLPEPASRDDEFGPWLDDEEAR